MCTYILPESGPQRQQQWQRWHRWHPDTQRAIGTSSKAGTKPLHLRIIINVIHKQKNYVHEGEHFLSWATDFIQGRTAKLHTCNFKGTWRFQKTQFNMKQHMGHRGISPGSMLWKLQPTSYQEKYHHKKEVGKTSHWCVPCSAGPQHEDPPLKGSAVPSSDSREHSSHRFQHLLPSLQGLWRLFLGVSVHMTIS